MLSLVFPQLVSTEQAAKGAASGSKSLSLSGSSMRSSSLSSSSASGGTPGANQNASAKTSTPNMGAVAEHIVPGNKYDLGVTNGPNGMPVGCESSSVEGGSKADPALIRQKLCLDKLKQEKKIVDAVQKKIQHEKDCNVKVNKKSMMCHVKKVMQDVVQKEKYTIEEIDNIILLKVAGKIVLAEVVEVLNYDVQAISKPRETQLEDPKYAVSFNTIGGLVDQKGTPPTQSKPKNDPCSECLQKLNMQASTVEGGVDDCSYTCDDDGLQQFINGGYFTVSKPQTKPGAEAAPGPQTKPAAG